MTQIKQKNITMKSPGDSHINLEFAEIFESELAFENLIEFFAMRDTYYEVVRNALRRGKVSYAEVLNTCIREPKFVLDDPEIKAYAATAKYYLHKFGIKDEDIPEWIENMPPCEFLTPFVINAYSLKTAATTCPPEFLEKNILVCARDFQIV